MRPMAKSQFLTNYGLVLIHVATNPDSRLRDISAACGITERAVTGILRTMEADKLISTRKNGRSNHYRVDFRVLLDHEIGGPYTLQELIKGLSDIYESLQNQDRTDNGPPRPPGN